MNQDDYDRVLGLIRTQCKSDLIQFLKVLRQNGFSQTETAYGLIFIAAALPDESLSIFEATNACRAGELERKRGALRDCHTKPVTDKRTPR